MLSVCASGIEKENKPLKVLDLCASPGGKTGQIACMVGDDSIIFSNEIIRCLTKDYNYIDKEIHVNFQNHSKKVGFAYTKDEFYQVSNLIHNDSNVNFQLNQ